MFKEEKMGFIFDEKENNELDHYFLILNFVSANILFEFNQKFFW